MVRRSVGRATYEARPNIALVKFWGVRDVERVLPFNSSLSVTLDRLRSRTTVVLDPGRSRDAFALNGRRAVGPPLRAVGRILDEVRQRSGSTAGAVVRSENNFPTASGLASSASGFAALAGAATSAAHLALSPRELSKLARLGSGSASRSVFGGFVEWRAGRRPDGSDCYSIPLFPPDHWPELIDRVAVVRGAPVKAIRSGVAMQATVRTSPEYRSRLREIPSRLRRMKRAIRSRESEALFDLVIEECDSFRRVCETTSPSLDYLTATSRAILSAVRAQNRRAGRTVAAYTHDAGAHVHVFTTRPDLSTVRRALDRVPGVQRWWTLTPGAGGRLVGGLGDAGGSSGR